VYLSTDAVPHVIAGQPLFTRLTSSVEGRRRRSNSPLSPFCVFNSIFTSR